MTGLAGYLGLAGFTWLAVFQILLAAGAPLGHMAWGGSTRVLPGRLRVASLAAAAIAVFGAQTVAQAAGLAPALLPELFIRPLLGLFAALFAFSLLGNAASKSWAERLHGVPLAALLCLSSLLLAGAG